MTDTDRFLWTRHAARDDAVTLKPHDPTHWRSIRWRNRSGLAAASVSSGLCTAPTTGPVGQCAGGDCQGTWLTSRPRRLCRCGDSWCRQCDSIRARARTKERKKERTRGQGRGNLYLDPILPCPAVRSRKCHNWLWHSARTMYALPRARVPIG